MKRLTMLLLLIVVPLFTAMESPLGTRVRETRTIVNEEVKFTPADLQAYLLEINVKHPEVVFAQAILETGNFSSPIYLENHNLFGMKYVDTLTLKQRGSTYRPTVAEGERYNHAYYSDWRRSVDDYLLWQQMFKRTPIDERSQYLHVLGRYYCPTRGYSRVLIHIMQGSSAYGEFNFTSLRKPPARYMPSALPS